MIVTAGGIDQPASISSRRSRFDEALSNGITTMIGGGTGPATGTAGERIYAGCLEYGSDAGGRGRVADEPRFPGERQRGHYRAAGLSKSAPERAD